VSPSRVRRVLFLTPLPLDRPRSGGTIKSAAVLSYLERDHEVDVACLSPGASAWRRERGAVVAVPLSRPRSAARLLASYATRLPLSVERNRSRELAMRVETLAAREPYDAVFVDGWLMAQYVRSDFDGMRLLHEHNVEHEMWLRHARLERHPARRAIVRLEAARVRAYERSILRAFDVVFAVSEPDRQTLTALGAEPAGIRVLPNVADASLLERPALEPIPEPVVLFLGTLSWPPNAEGLERYLRVAHPALRARVPGARLLVAGRGAPDALASIVRSTSGAELVTDADDDEALYRRARCFVDPSVGGAGTRVKILNAMARGLPVVATTDAATGLEAADGIELLTAGDPAAIAAGVERVLTDDGVWHASSEAGRRLVADRYTPDTAFGALDEVLGGAG
jgi:glycosyltransferase involved in cell wall biosynthesis